MVTFLTKSYIGLELTAACEPTSSRTTRHMLVFILFYISPAVLAAGSSMLLRCLRRRYQTVFEFEDFARERLRLETTPSALASRSPEFGKPLPDNFLMQPIKHVFTNPPTLKHGLDKIVRTEGIYTSRVMSDAYGSDFLM